MTGQTLQPASPPPTRERRVGRDGVGALERRPTQDQPSRVVPVPRQWPALSVALLCGLVPLVAGLSITTLAVLTDDPSLDSTLISLGLLTLLVGSGLFLVGWVSLVGHWTQLRRLSAEERELAPDGLLAASVLLVNLPAALVCLVVGASSVPVAAC